VESEGYLLFAGARPWTHTHGQTDIHTDTDARAHIHTQTYKHTQTHEYQEENEAGEDTWLELESIILNPFSALGLFQFLLPFICLFHFKDLQKLDTVHNGKR
jgi:hypothetical protein